MLVVGPYGVLGTGVIDAALRDPDWGVVTAARRPPPGYHFVGREAPRHVGIDLLDRPSAMAALSALGGVTDLVFAAYVEGETMAAGVEPNRRMMANTLDGLSNRDTPLRHVVLMGGAKSYGFHLGSFNAPAKESQARILAPIHYHQQEDMLAEWSNRTGGAFTVLRPHVVMGPSVNSPMNLVTGLATYAAMSRERGVPLRFPGSAAGWSALQQTMDAEVLGRATIWALGAATARNEIFNITNGDEFRWRQLWTVLADFYGIPVAEPLPMSLTEQMGGQGDLWDTIVARHGLVPTSYGQIANWAFLDYMLNFSDDTTLSTIKIRHAGFGESLDTHDSFLRQLTRLREMRLIP
ncbi:SDR family oxidoreductase [Methylobacterium sp. P1-11]|nr:SDR family oxidoreductase [Methylobacterium sp. P1-11]